MPHQELLMHIDRKVWMVVLFPVAFILLALPVALWLGYDEGSFEDRGTPQGSNVIPNSRDGQAVTPVPGQGDAVAGQLPPVRLLAKSFSPDNLTVQRGKEVTFTVEEGDQHTITIGGDRKSGVLKKGDTFTWEPDRPGDYFITCDFVPEMRAAITTP